MFSAPTGLPSTGVGRPDGLWILKCCMSYERCDQARGVCLADEDRQNLKRVGGGNGSYNLWSLALSHCHSCIIAESFQSILVIPMSFLCHSDVISYSKTWRNFCDGTTPKWKYLSLQGRFILERDGMTHGPHLTERQERAWNDPQYLTKEGQTVSKEGQTTPDIRSFPFSFLSFGPRSSFEGRLESFGKERSIWNDLRTRSERGKGRGRSGLISPIERHHSCIILLSFCSF